MKLNIFTIIFAASALSAMAQAGPDALNISQQDMRGTARFLGMGGAFGALGGDISAINFNPGGIGIYRNSDIAITLDLNPQSTQASTASGAKSGAVSNTFLDVNNFGYVGAYRTGSNVMPIVNFGVTYNRNTSFRRRYSGNMPQIGTSLSNSIATLTTHGGYTDKDLIYTDKFNPYIDGMAPWISILAYDSFLISPNSTNGYNGLMGSGTTGFGEFEIQEEGKIDEYSITLGGNILDKVYWGMGFGIVDIDYNAYNYYGESLENAYLVNENGNPSRGDASFGLTNVFRTFGTGYNFKMGFIIKPINEFRIGLAFHTPTFYSLKDEAYSVMSYGYANGIEGEKEANDGYYGESWYKISTPWRVIASAAAVLGGKGIISVDYEWVNYPGMRISSDNGFEYTDLTNDIQKYYRSVNILRAGAEFRLTNSFSVRAGYSWQSSPVNDELLNNELVVNTAGTVMSYMLPKTTQTASVGFGYRYKSFYTDLTYMIKKRDLEYRAFSPDEGAYDVPGMSIDEKNHHVVLTLGFRF